MKVRSSFVANSSSSSFICDVSGHVESGWDLSMDDANMYECENGHTCCIDYFLPFDKNSVEFKQILLDTKIKNMEKPILHYTKCLKDDALSKYHDSYKSYIEKFKKDIEYWSNLANLEDIDIEEISEDYSCQIPAKYCPICSFEHIVDSDAIRYIYKKYNITSDEIKKEIKAKFETYNDFMEYLKNE